MPGGAIPSLQALPNIFGDVEPHVLLVGGTALATMVLWPARFARWLPAPLAALVAGSLLGVLWLTEARTIGPIPAVLPQLQLTMPSLTFVISALQSALILALPGSIDSLLAGMVADSLTGSRHNPNRELFGQGIGNVIAGLIGGLPGAGASVSTVTNIRAGASRACRAPCGPCLCSRWYWNWGTWWHRFPTRFWRPS